MTPALTPELYVSDLEMSLAFYRDLIGFEVAYDRPEDRFAALQRGSAALMLEEPIGRTWLTAPLEVPFGRGMNLQIMVENVVEIYQRCQHAGAEIFLPLETKAYRRRDETVSQTQFVVRDPDGYLIRLAELESPGAKEID